MPFTTNLNLEQPANGAYVGTWDVPMNSNFGLLDSAIAAATSVALTNVPVTLSAAQYQNKFITFTGPLTGNVQVTFPAVSRTYVLYDNASGTTGFRVTCICSGGPTAITLPIGTPVVVSTNGTNMWIAGLSRINVQRFTSNGTYTPSAGMRFCKIVCIGGGGGGGGVRSTIATNIVWSGGGGGGGYATTQANAAQIGASQAVTIGTSGAAGDATPTNGSAGGTTSVGTLCTATGGGAGAAAQDATNNTGTGAVGGSGTGDFVIQGGSAGAGSIANAGSGGNGGNFGGNAALGYGAGGAAPVPTNNAAVGVTGTAGGSYGGGGSGAIIYATTGGAAGGAGAAGLAVIIEYIG